MNRTNQPLDLFTKNESPIIFRLPPGLTKKKLAPIIRHYGGKVTSKRLTDSICLADEKLWTSNSNISRDSDHYWPTYILDCVKQKALLDIEKYRCSRGTRLMHHIVIRDEDFGVCEHGESDENIDTPNIDSEESVTHTEDSMDIDDMAPADVIISVPVHKKGRSAYTVNDDMKILRYLMENGEYRRAKGLAVWKTMQNLEVTSHSAQSMFTRFRKVIIMQLNQYNIPDYWKSCLSGNPMYILSDETDNADKNPAISGETTMDASLPEPRISAEDPSEDQSNEKDIETDCSTIDIDVEFDSFDKKLLEISNCASGEKEENIDHANAGDAHKNLSLDLVFEDISDEEDPCLPQVRSISVIGIASKARGRTSDKNTAKSTMSQHRKQYPLRSSNEEVSCENSSANESTSKNLCSNKNVQKTNGKTDIYFQDERPRRKVAYRKLFSQDENSGFSEKSPVQNRQKLPPKSRLTERANKRPVSEDLQKRQSPMSTRLKHKSPHRPQKIFKLQMPSTEISSIKPAQQSKDTELDHKAQLYSRNRHAARTAQRSGTHIVAEEESTRRTSPAVSTSTRSLNNKDSPRQLVSEQCVVTRSRNEDSPRPSMSGQNAVTRSHNEDSPRQTVSGQSAVTRSHNEDSPRQTVSGRSAVTRSHNNKDIARPAHNESHSEDNTKAPVSGQKVVCGSRCNGSSQNEFPQYHTNRQRRAVCETAAARRQEFSSRRSLNIQSDEEDITTTGNGSCNSSPLKNMHGIIQGSDTEEEEDRQKANNRRWQKRLTCLGVLRGLSEEFDLTLKEAGVLLHRNSGRMEATRYWIQTGQTLPGHQYWTPQADTVLLNETPDSPAWQRLEQQMGLHAVLERIQWLED